MSNKQMIAKLWDKKDSGTWQLCCVPWVARGTVEYAKL